MKMHEYRVMVLAGGPDRERDVSLMSGGEVTAALREAGHEVRQRDIGPGDLGALDEFVAWHADVIFPVLHGAWGEGGDLQAILDRRGLPYVGCREKSARLCMDKVKTKRALQAAGLPTPPFETVASGRRPNLSPPLVLKAPSEGSSIDLFICPDQASVDKALGELGHRHGLLMAERFVRGPELTVGVLAEGVGNRSLPAIRIVPATAFYDYDAKYLRDDTRYLFGDDTGLPPEALTRAESLAQKAHEVLGCRHLSRVDLMVDADTQMPWILEINTLPGFTTHSLLPMAARRCGIAMPALVDRLVMLAAGERAADGDQVRESA